MPHSSLLLFHNRSRETSISVNNLPPTNITSNTNLRSALLRHDAVSVRGDCRATVPRPSRLQAGSWSWRHYHHRTLTYRPMAIWKREKWNKRRRGEIVQRGAAMFASHLAAIMRVPTPVPYCYWFPFHHFTNYTFPSACNHSCLLHYDDEQFMAILPVKYTSHPAVFSVFLSVSLCIACDEKSCDALRFSDVCYYCIYTTCWRFWAIITIKTVIYSSFFPAVFLNICQITSFEAVLYYCIFLR